MSIPCPLCMSPISEASRASRPATQQSGRPQTQQSSSATGTGAGGSRPQTQQSQRPGTTQSMAAMTNVAAVGKLKSLDITWICLKDDLLYVFFAMINDTVTFAFPNLNKSKTFCICICCWVDGWMLSCWSISCRKTWKFGRRDNEFKLGKIDWQNPLLMVDSLNTG